MWVSAGRPRLLEFSVRTGVRPFSRVTCRRNVYADDSEAPSTAPGGSRRTGNGPWLSSVSRAGVIRARTKTLFWDISTLIWSGAAAQIAIDAT
jgi:hypothetical protein